MSHPPPPTPPPPTPRPPPAHVYAPRPRARSHITRRWLPQPAAVCAAGCCRRSLMSWTASRPPPPRAWWSLARPRGLCVRCARVRGAQNPTRDARFRLHGAGGGRLPSTRPSCGRVASTRRLCWRCRTPRRAPRLWSGTPRVCRWGRVPARRPRRPRRRPLASAPRHCGGSARGRRRPRCAPARRALRRATLRRRQRPRAPCSARACLRPCGVALERRTMRPGVSQLKPSFDANRVWLWT